MRAAYALGYIVQNGWAVFPLQPNSKLPYPGSAGFKDASKDIDHVGYTFPSDANIGIATGEVSDLVVLDVDNKHGGLASWETIKDLLPETYTVSTPHGGFHCYFKHPKTKVGNKQGVLPGIDIRGDGGYVVAPPSQLPGGYYTVSVDAPLADWPAHLFPNEPKTSSYEPNLSAGEKGTLAKSTMHFILFGAEPGKWHSAFYKACIDLKQQGYSEQEAKEKLESAGHVLDSSHDIPCLRDVYKNREPKHPPRYAEAGADGAIPPRFEVPEDLQQVLDDLAPLDCRPEIGGIVAVNDKVNDIKPPLFIKAVDLVAPMVLFLNDKDKVRGEPTGLAGLDQLLGGGYRTGEVTCWHAEAKTGKNTLWHKLMHLALARGSSGPDGPALSGSGTPMPMGYASRELTPESEVLPNLLSLHFRKNVWLEQPDSGAYTAALGGWPLYFAPGYGVFELDDLRSWVASLREHGVKLFWFDHLHYMLDDPEDHKAASKLIKEIKTMAKQEDINVQIIIQPNKLAEGQALSLNSIKGGAAMGQAVDNIITMERVKQPGSTNVVKVTLKHARSKLANPGDMYLQYDKNTTDFVEVEWQPDNTEAAPPRPAWGMDKQLRLAD